MTTKKPKAGSICFCRSGKMKQVDICACKCCEHEATMIGNWNPTKRTMAENFQLMKSIRSLKP